MRNHRRNDQPFRLNELAGECRMHVLLEGHPADQGCARRSRDYEPGRLGQEFQHALRRLA